MATSRSGRYVFYIIIAAVIVYIILHVSLRKAQHKPLHAAVAVKVATVVEKAVPVALTAPGRVESVQSVNVRSQISGILNHIDFKAGDYVTQGQLLFTIDPSPFLTTLAQAKANLMRDQAHYNEIQKNVERLRTLIKDNYISQQAFSEVMSQAAMQRATLKVDQEKVKEAMLKLAYAKIHAPIAGKTGDVSVKEGDLITTASAEPLVSINKINPVYVSFNLTQKELPKILKFRKLGPLTVNVFAENNNEKIGSGTLDFIDNAINTDSGTILLKGLINNDNTLLWPSQLVTVELILTINKHALVVPSSAIKNDDTGQFVYLVQGNKVSIKYVKAHQLGDITVIESNELHPGDQIVSMVPPSLENGSMILIVKAGTR